IKVRQSWTFIGNFTRLAAARLSRLVLPEAKDSREIRSEPSLKFFGFFSKKDLRDTPGIVYTNNSAHQAY
ncbi:hypothetical protein, partial [Agathobaculum hominis]